MKLATNFKSGVIYTISLILIIFCSSCGSSSTSSDHPITPTPPTDPAKPNTVSPVAMFSKSEISADFRNSVFTEKKTRNYKTTEDTVIDGVFIPSNSLVKVTQYDEQCLLTDCISFNQITPSEAAEIKLAVLDSNSQISRLNPANYIFQNNSAVRGVWRWSSLMDGFLHTAAEIDELRQKGIKLIPTISADRIGYRHPAYSTIGKACVTKDLTDTFDPRFGYSKLYFDWITSLLLHYGDVLYMLIIENEVDQHNNAWCEPTPGGTPADPLAGRRGYAKMVVTAKYAVQQSASSTLVSDSGMMGSTWIRLALISLVDERRADPFPTDAVDTELERNILELGSQIVTQFPERMGHIDWIGIYVFADSLKLSPTNPMLNAQAVIDLLNSNVINADLGGVTPLDVYNHHNHSTSSSVAPVAHYIRKVFAKAPDNIVINNEMGLLASKTSKTLAANNISLLTYSEFLPVTNYAPTGEIELTGGVDVGGTQVILPPRSESIATEDLMKKFLHSFGNGVSLVSYFGFNGDGGTNETKTAVIDGSPYHFFSLTGINMSSTITEDHLLVAPNFRAILNLRDLFDSAVNSSVYSRSNNMESYEFELTDKTIKTWWVQAYKANLDVNNVVIPEDIDISAELALGCSFYDMEGFAIARSGGVISVGLAPVFAECGK